MKVKPTVFRMYDIRGIADQDITEEFAYHLGRAFGSWVVERGGHRVVVGQDVRPHSAKYREALIRGLVDTGLAVHDLGTVPTPLMYFSLFHLPDIHGGIQVTASHNPREYNGFKMNIGQDTVYGDMIQQLRRRMEEEAYHRPAAPGSRTPVDIVTPYLDWVSRNLDASVDFAVGVDTGNGTAGPIMEQLFDRFGVRYRGLYLEPDGTFPNHLPDPTVVKYMQDLIGLVTSEGLALGLGLDGDADRLGVVTHDGELLFGDKILGIFARDVLERNPGATIIFDVKCSQGLIEYIQRLGGKPLMWKTGHSLLKVKLKETGAPLAGEMSGHIFFKDRFFGYDDAIYAAFRLLEILKKTGKTLRELADEIPTYFSTPEIRVGCPDDRKFAVVQQVVQDFKAQGYEVIDIDGARVQFADGFGLIRASNTQPVLVVRCEGKTEAARDRICGVLRKELEKFPEVDLSAMP